MVVRKANDLGIEKGNKLRTDCTVVESNIHHPTDSTLLGDCVRVFMRIMKTAQEEFGVQFCSRRLRAKRRVLEISNAKRMKQRVPLYRDLVKVTWDALSQAQRTAEQLEDVPCETMSQMALAQALIGEIRDVTPLAHRVLSQTERRVFHGEAVPVDEKLVSIFEPHTDIIIKANRETEYGHKICLTTGASSLVTDVVVETESPADSTLVMRTVERAKAPFGFVPRQVTFDGGFASKNNLADIEALGVKDAAFHKRRGLQIDEMTSSKRVYKRLRAFRAGIEGTISFLKRSFGLERCTWRGFQSFRAYVHASVLACNLLVAARHILAAPAAA